MSTLYPNHVKRILDFTFALSGLVILSPALISIALVLLSTGTRPIFVQVRPGIHGRPFSIFKFKTMTDKRDDAGNLVPDSLRISRTGRFLRATSLDELPQLYNVLIGDMSLVGPRPLLTAYLSVYTASENQRHSVKPGITGLAQINGGQALAWDEKMRLDNIYVQTVSFGLDMRIIAGTLKKWLTQKRDEAISVVIIQNKS